MPDNEVLKCIPQRDRDHKKMLFPLAEFSFEENTGADFFGLVESLTEIVVKYKLVTNLDRSAGNEYKPRTVSSYLDWDDLPDGHKVTIKLFDTDGVTLLSTKSADTKDGPILR